MFDGAHAVGDLRGRAAARNRALSPRGAGYWPAEPPCGTSATASSRRPWPGTAQQVDDRRTQTQLPVATPGRRAVALFEGPQQAAMSAGSMPGPWSRSDVDLVAVAVAAISIRDPSGRERRGVVRSDSVRARCAGRAGRPLPRAGRLHGGPPPAIATIGDLVAQAIQGVVHGVVQSLDPQVEVRGPALQARDLRIWFTRLQQAFAAGADDAGIFLVLRRAERTIELLGDDFGKAEDGVAAGCAAS